MRYLLYCGGLESNPRYLPGRTVLIRLVNPEKVSRAFRISYIGGCILSDNLNVNPNSIVSTFKALVLWNYRALVLNGFLLVSVHNLEREEKKEIKATSSAWWPQYFASWFALLALGKTVCRWQILSSSLSSNATQAA